MRGGVRAVGFVVLGALTAGLVAWLTGRLRSTSAVTALQHIEVVRTTKGWLNHHRARGQAPPSSDADQRATQFADYERRASQLSSEAYDPAWAPGAERAFRSELSDLGKQYAFSVREVTCRKTLCRADLQTASYAAMVKAAEPIAEGRFSNPCTRYVYHPPPGSDAGEYVAANGAYVAPVFFSCARDGP